MILHLNEVEVSSPFDTNDIKYQKVITFVKLETSIIFVGIDDILQLRVVKPVLSLGHG